MREDGKLVDLISPKVPTNLGTGIPLCTDIAGIRVPHWHSRGGIRYRPSLAVRLRLAVHPPRANGHYCCSNCQCLDSRRVVPCFLGRATYKW